jgi:hypothetical protein
LRFRTGFSFAALPLKRRTLAAHDLKAAVRGRRGQATAAIAPAMPFSALLPPYELDGFPITSRLLRFCLASAACQSQGWPETSFVDHADDFKLEA